MQLKYVRVTLGFLHRMSTLDPDENTKAQLEQGKRLCKQIAADNDVPLETVYPDQTAKLMLRDGIELSEEAEKIYNEFKTLLDETARRTHR